jgi:hypothetical protein
MNAIESGAVNFEESGTYRGGESVEELLAYFHSLKKRFEALVDSVDSSTAIDWFGESASLNLHLTRLLSHETLHHGELILYVRALGKSFPESWSGWGE